LPEQVEAPPEELPEQVEAPPQEHHDQNIEQEGSEQHPQGLEGEQPVEQPTEHHEEVEQPTEHHEEIEQAPEQHDELDQHPQGFEEEQPVEQPTEHHEEVEQAPEHHDELDQHPQGFEEEQPVEQPTEHHDELEHHLQGSEQEQPDEQEYIYYDEPDQQVQKLPEQQEKSLQDSPGILIDQSLEGIKRRKELLERIIETAPSIIIGINHEGNITIFNDAAEMITGYTKDEAVYKSFLDLLIPDEHKEETKAIFDKTHQGVSLHNIEKHIVTKGKEERLILWSSAPIDDSEGILSGEIFIGNDITEKSIMINEIIRQNKELTAINSVGLSLSNGNNLDNTLKNALDRVLEIVNPAGGCIFTMDEREEKLILRASSGISPETSEVFRQIKRGKGILGKVHGAKHHILLKNLQLFSDRSQKYLKKEGFESMLFLPLRVKRGTIGVLAIGARESQNLTPENIKVFTTISNQLGIMIDNFWLSCELSFVGKEWENTMNTITDPIALISTEKRVLWVNIAYARLMSALPKDLIGKSCCDIFHNEMSPIHSCLHKKVFETKTGFTEEIYDETTGATSLVTCSPYTNAKGEMIGTMIVTKDITEKKEAENEIRYLKEFNENIVESLGDGVEIIGPDYKIQYMSKNFHSSIGKDVIGKTCYQVHFESDKPCEGCPIEKGIEGMGSETLECPTSDGKNLLITHSPLKNQDGSFSAVLLFKPVSKDHEQDEEPERISPEKDGPKPENIPTLNSLISGIKHELHNPLGGIAGYAKELEDEDDPIKMRILAREIADSTKRMTDLVDCLKEGASKAQNSIYEKVDLNEIIINSLNTLNQDEKFESVEVETDLQPVPKVVGDPLEIFNVFINLISNSLETMKGQGKIHILTTTQNGNVKIVFTDSGTQIPQEDLGKIFDPFYGLNEGEFEEGSPEEKMGFRMYNISSTLKKYNAPITVDSKPDEGISFTISFPYKTQTPEDN
jgi:PAS domain S-box-containing protein